MPRDELGVTVRVDPALDPGLEVIVRHILMFSVIGVGVGLDLVPDVLGVSEAREVPACMLNDRKLPAVVPKVVGPGALEDFVIRDDRPEPRLARKLVLERVLEHPHVDRIDDMREFLERHLREVRDLVDIADHDDGLWWDAFAPTQDALALVLFAGPGILVLWGLLGRHDDVVNLRKPLGKALLVFLKVEGFGATRVVHFRLDEYETIDIPVQEVEAELEYRQFIIEHKRVDEHIKDVTSFPFI